MPDLTPWIEAQLKRGHSKEEIKNYLTSLGYPATAIATVDKVDKMKPSNLSNQSKRAMSMPKGLVVILPIVAISIVGILMLFLTDSLSSSRHEKAGEQSVIIETSETANKTVQPEQALPTSELPDTELCSAFKGNDRKACGELVFLVNSRYPGNITKVEKLSGGADAFVLSLVTKVSKLSVTASAAENSIIVKDVATSETVNRSTFR